MSQEHESVQQEPTHEDRLGYLEYLVESGRFSTSKGQPYSPITDHAKIITQVEIWLCLKTTDPVSTPLEKFEEKMFLKEQQNMIDAEKQQSLSRIKDLRQAVIAKLCLDKKAKGPEPLGSSIYLRTLNTNDGRLQVDYSIDGKGQDHLQITLDKNHSTCKKQGNRRIHECIYIDQNGYFRNYIVNVKPNNTSETFAYELGGSVSNLHSATPEVIEKVVNLMNLYLQENNKNSFIKKIRQQILSKLPK